MRDQLVRALRKTPLETLREALRLRRVWREGLRQGTFAQDGEDKFVLEYFQGKPGRYLEIGANHPFALSNTYLLYRHGWRGVTFEPIPRLHAKHRELRPEDTGVNAAVGEQAGELTFYEMNSDVLSSFRREVVDHLIEQGAWVKREYLVPVLSIEAVVDEHRDAGPVDFFSLDTEGFDLPILKAMPWDKLRPTLVSCEQATGDDDEAAEANRILEAQGYRPVCTTAHNRIFAAS